MRFGTLAFGRRRYSAVVAKKGGKPVYLRKEDEEEWFRNEVLPEERRAWDERIGEWKSQRAKILSEAKVESSVQVKNPDGGIFGGRMTVDRITVDGETHQVKPGMAEEFLRSHIDVILPKPTEQPLISFAEWRGQQEKEEVRDWHAEFITSDGVQPIDIVDRWSWWGCPLPAIATALGTLADEGWRLVHVSEDRGLYKGEDTGSESAPSRLRYLLESE